MSMMLVAIFAAAGVGIFADQFGRRESIICGAIAVGLVVLYFIRPYYMT